MSGATQVWERACTASLLFCYGMLVPFVACGVIQIYTGWPLDPVGWSLLALFMAGNGGIAVRAWYLARRERALAALAGDDP